MAFIHTVDHKSCKGCGICIHFCPKNVLETTDKVNTDGYFPAYQAKPADCIHCSICCLMCPDVAITIETLQ